MKSFESKKECNRLAGLGREAEAAPREGSVRERVHMHAAKK